MTYVAPPRVKLSRKMALDGLAVFETAYPAKLREPTHDHAFPFLTFVVAGGYVDRLRPNRECGPGTLAVVPAGMDHAIDYGSRETRCLLLEVHPRYCELLRDYTALLDYPLLLNDGAVSILTLRLYRELCTDDSDAPLAVEGLFLEIVANANRARRPVRWRGKPRFADEARAILHEEFRSRVRISEVASRLGVHPVHLAREFRARYQLSPFEYLRHLRIEWASEQLAKTDRTLSEIALEAGFADQSHFTRRFREATGCTPGAYRAVVGE